MRIAIAHQGFVPSYRVRFFELLDELGKHEYVVFHGDPPSGVGHFAAEGPFSFPNVEVRNVELRIAGKSLIYQTFLRQLLAERFDAAIFGTHVQFLSNQLALPLMKARGRPVFYWGHATEKTTGGNGVALALSRAAAAVKARTVRIADGYLAYTPRGVQTLIHEGFDPRRVVAVGNTLDMDEQIALHAELQRVEDEQMREQLGLAPDSVVLVYLGRIYADKRVGDLVQAVRRIEAQPGAPPVQAVIVGDGPDAQSVREGAREMASVRFTGELRDQREIARYLRVAAAVVVPGALGLAVNHALAHGVPVISRWTPLHGPEVEYLTPGRDSLIVEGDVDRFVAALSEFVASPGQRRELAEAALAARVQLSLEAMALAFDAGVSTLLEAAGRSAA